MKIYYLFIYKSNIFLQWSQYNLKLELEKFIIPCGLRFLLCVVLVEPKAPCYHAHVCVRNSGFSRILSPTTRDHFRAMFLWFSYPEKTWRTWQLFATIALCAHIARLFNDVGKFSMCKINLSYFLSRARLSFRWIFKEFDLESNIKGFSRIFLLYR